MSIPTTEAKIAKPKVRGIPTRPDSIKIKESGDISYADILQKVRAAPSLKTFSERVACIRRTKIGELLLELVKPGTLTQKLQSVVSSTLKASGEVYTLKHREAVLVKDTDESSTAEEVAEAITVIFGPVVVEPQQMQLRKFYQGT